MEIWLSGPERFFKEAQRCGILPWDDDDDDDVELALQCDDGPDQPKKNAESPLDSDLLVERSPHDPLPANWQSKPLSSGVSIRVIPPTMGAGKILNHCKDTAKGNKTRNYRGNECL